MLLGSVTPRRTWVALAAASLVCTASACDRHPGPNLVQPPPPPPPQVFDLRFKGVGSLSSDTDLVHTNIYATTKSALRARQDSAAGTPLEIGTGLCSPSECDWFYDVYSLPANLARVGTMYRGDILANLPFDLNTATSDTVITSLDLHPEVGVLGFSAMFASQGGGYTLHQQLVAPGALQAAASQEGTLKRVITALSFDAGSVRFVSYAWQHDSTAGYDAQVATASFSTAEAAARSLASSGYTITAVGGDSTDGFILVGTKLHGDTSPRNIIVNPSFTDTLPGYAPVIYLLQSPPGSVTLILEK